MLTVKQLKPDVYELTLEGVLDKSDIQTMEKELTPALKKDGPLGLIVRAEGWRDITGDAIAEDMKFEFGMIAEWSKVARMALVSDLQAFDALMKWIDPILPMMDMRSFSASEVAAAEAFVSDLPAKAQSGADGGVTLLADGTDGLIAYEVHGTITAEDVDKVVTPLEPHLADDRKVNVLVRFKSYEGFDPAILSDGSLMGTKMSAITHLGRYAVVGAPKWMASMVGAMSAMMPFQMRMFELSEEDAAWTWARGQ